MWYLIIKERQKHTDQRKGYKMEGLFFRGAWIFVDEDWNGYSEASYAEALKSGQTFKTIADFLQWLNETEETEEFKQDLKFHDTLFQVASNWNIPVSMVKWFLQAKA